MRGPCSRTYLSSVPRSTLFVEALKLISFGYVQVLLFFDHGFLLQASGFNLLPPSTTTWIEVRIFNTRTKTKNERCSLNK